MFGFLSQKFSGVLSWLKDKGRLTEENVEQALAQVKDALLEADVPYEIVDTFLQEIKSEAVGQKVTTTLNPGQHFIKIVYNKLLNFLGGESSVATSFQIPSVIMVMGLQGSGKTTTIAKLAHWCQKEAQKKNKKRNILLTSVDFYRPAAIDQLEILAKKVNCVFFRAPSTDPIKAAKEIYNHFKNNGFEHLFLDTAGRLQVDENMMQELVQIEKIITPKYKILVLDIMTGQESLRVAKTFDEKVGFNSAILSKMDSDARGGAAFAFRYALKKPISFVGFGEKIEDLESFIPQRMASRILGMGDILTLIEKAEETIDTKKQDDFSKRLFEGNFNLEDFAKQIEYIDKMGSLKKIMQYIPGVSQIPADKLDSGQKEMKIFKAIISSMTKKERICPQILDASRKQRIAKGSGTSAQDVNQLLARFEQSKQFVKNFKKMGNFRGF
ncbi:TPA: signal recognition particle protein [Candidatus Dependentiae bacterium]|nr:MAG: Signal recognition particle protein [candidate division TM6 bacterium GW2011_GWE2_31_21]KKP54158.1 MAG: Signal recognition particle protein [candidate division TM6 bacterium GW2011_GWF2_33_332]HBS47879.1 signal recognition particle protein [Candidatus Dependentiae bacterium]HBZ73064.1 signal recognition particle protein [Candidatus Dependentiae bacterium]